LLQLGSNGYKEGEWFCRDFKDNGEANPKAVQELENIREKLSPSSLYKAEQDEDNLIEFPFDQLKSAT
jgi:hypothetical protein